MVIAKLIHTHDMSTSFRKHVITDKQEKVSVQCPILALKTQ